MKRSFKQRVSYALQNPALICFIWFGMTAGVSILATYARFAAPTITRAIALDVGRVVFAVLNKAELVALILLLIVVRVSNLSRQWWAISAVLTLIVMAQSVWLLPELADRTAQIVSGTEPAPSIVHAAYSTLELIKLGLLFSMGVAAISTDQTARSLSR